jgi:hypothetical protein
VKRVLVLLVAGTVLSGAAAVYAAANANAPTAKPGVTKPQGRIVR